MTLNIFRSLTNSKNWLDVKHLITSVVIILKIYGEKLPPLGTSEVTKVGIQQWSWIFTICIREVRYDLNQDNKSKYHKFM